MADLDARPVDPRRSQWELSDPSYRVDFWQRIGDAFQSREYNVTASGVEDVLAWARDHRRDDETFTVFVAVDRDGLGLVRVAGTDPTR